MLASTTFFSKSRMKRLQVHHTPKPLEVSVSANEQQTLFPYLLVAFSFVGCLLKHPCQL